MIKGVAPSMSTLLILEPVTLTLPSSWTSSSSAASEDSDIVASATTSTSSSTGSSATTNPTLRKANKVKKLKFFIIFSPYLCIKLQRKHVPIQTIYL